MIAKTAARIGEEANHSEPISADISPELPARLKELSAFIRQQGYSDFSNSEGCSTCSEFILPE